MPLEVLQQTTHNSATSRFQFDFSYPSTIQERSRRSPEFWRSQPSPRTCGSSRTLKPLSQLPPVCTNNISRDLKETDDVRINMSGSYGGYGAGQHNTSYTLPAGDHRTHNGPSSVPYNGQSQYRSISQPISRAVSRPASPVFPPIETASKSRNSIVSYLQIPSTISSSRGSLAEFAAQVRCLDPFPRVLAKSFIDHMLVLVRGGYYAFTDRRLKIVPNNSNETHVRFHSIHRFLKMGYYDTLHNSGYSKRHSVGTPLRV